MIFFDDYTRPMPGRTFAISSENRDGSKGGGSRGSETEKVHPCDDIAPGETFVLADIEGPGTVRHIWMTCSNRTHFILRIYWDGEEHPSVEAPLTAFFGYAFHENLRDVFGNFPTLSSALTACVPSRGLSAFFRMPFRRRCRITVENRGPETRTLYYTVTGVLEDIPEDSMYFHASYRQSFPLARGDAHTIIDSVEGRGRYIGTTLAAGVNAPNGCWVEGEAKMYIDGDKYPSLNYTGTEDYFNGAYAFGYDGFGRYQPYNTLYAGMFAVIGGDIADRSASVYNVQPRFMAYRWHLPDPILFEHDFRMTLLNMGFRNGKDGIVPFGRHDDFATVAYWYQTHPFKPLAPLPADEDMFV